MSEQTPNYTTEQLKVVKSVTLTVSSDWAELLRVLQTEKGKGRRLVLVNVRDFRIAPVAEFERSA